MSSPVQLDHVVVAVRDLREASRVYEALGFNVVAGGCHGHAPTRNALIAFTDGSFIELIEWTAHSPDDRWQRVLEQDGEGLVDFALSVADLPELLGRARRLGIEMYGPMDGSRVTPSGHRLRWQVGRPASSELPFLCADITPRTLRVPDGDARMHPNGVVGMDTVLVAVRDAHASLDTYRCLFEVDVGRDQAPGAQYATDKLGVTACVAKLKGCGVALVCPAPSAATPAATYVGRIVERRGAGAYAISLCLPEGREARSASPAETCGLYLRFSPIAESLDRKIYPAD
jgi:catechol 2,3-dioxygenase-like lactoylglutathione lyase family enzyme